ncbi:MAG: zinc ribbon domain-containing protein [Chloroflexi bacterium]|nr:zinc ribbon domain-containing protein [Chloroflexota bacterium]
MPIYEYECKKCRTRFEMRRCFDEDGGSPCPQCGGQAWRIFSPVGIIFKGAGFYVTDSRKNHPSGEGKADHGGDGSKLETAGGKDKS